MTSGNLVRIAVALIFLMQSVSQGLYYPKSTIKIQDGNLQRNETEFMYKSTKYGNSVIANKFGTLLSECDRSVLDENEYIILRNDSLLTGNAKIYPSDSYTIQDGKAYVCDSTDDTASTPTHENQKFSQEFLSCGRILLTSNEFRLLSNGSVRVDIYLKTYNQSDYYMSKTGVYICVPEYSEMNGNFSNSSVIEIPKFSHSFIYISRAGIFISTVSLFLNLLVFCVVPNVRNLPGCCLASLSLSLLCAYLCFLSSSVVMERDQCAVLGATMYYFFLGSFFWVNVISFDVWRSFRVAMKELRISTHRVPRRRFLAYSAYSWIVPAILACLAKVIDNSDIIPQEYRPSFGSRICWFGQRKALLVFFASPLFLIMAVNAIFFLDSAYIINGAALKTFQSNATVLKRRFFTLMRLALIMGLTWISGIFAGYINHEILWYVFVILNTLQGLFIFIVFSCSSKVRGYFRIKIFGLQRSRQGTSVRTISQAPGTV